MSTSEPRLLPLACVCTNRKLQFHATLPCKSLSCVCKLLQFFQIFAKIDTIFPTTILSELKTVLIYLPISPPTGCECDETKCPFQKGHHYFTVRLSRHFYKQVENKTSHCHQKNRSIFNGRPWLLNFAFPTIFHHYLSI